MRHELTIDRKRCHGTSLCHACEIIAPGLVDYCNRHGRVLLGMVAAMQSVYFLELAERRPKDEKYQYGWQLNRAIGAVM